MSNDFQSLQRFVESTFKLKGTWSSPSGHLKLFNEDAENIIIRYYTNTTSLLLPGDEGKKFMNILAKKITGNESVTVREGKTKSSNCDLMMVVQYCQTYTDREDGKILTYDLYRSYGYKKENAFTDRTNRTDRGKGLRIVNKIFQPVKESVCDHVAALKFVDPYGSYGQ